MTDIIKKQLESILFLHGESVSVKKLASVTKTSKKEVEEILLVLQKEYETRGIHLIQKDEEWQMVTSSESKNVLDDLVKEEFSENLSRAALETLAVVAYKGPLTRAEIDFIRGVNSVYSLRNIMMRGLIEKKENPKDGRSHIYSITIDFLRHFGLTHFKDIPRYEEFHTSEVPELPLETNN